MYLLFIKFKSFPSTKGCRENAKIKLKSQPRLACLDMKMGFMFVCIEYTPPLQIAKKAVPVKDDPGARTHNFTVIPYNYNSKREIKPE